MIKKYFQLTSETPNKVFTYAERRPKKKKKKKCDDSQSGEIGLNIYGIYDNYTLIHRK